MLEQPISLVNVLSISTIITSFVVFFSGVPICIQIYRQRHTNDISGMPFLTGFLLTSFWLRYGLLKQDFTLTSVNVFGSTLMFFYMLFYWWFSKPRRGFFFKMLIVFTLFGLMLILVQIFQQDSLKTLGLVAMLFNILFFASPLAGMAVVLRNRSCATLPLPMCITNLLVSAQWALYCVLVNEIFVLIPNIAGVILSTLQISLFLIFPRKEGTHAPLAKCCPCVLDLEKAEADDDAIVEDEESRSVEKF